MPFRWRRPKTAEDLFRERWWSWWDRTGRGDVIRLLAEYRCATDPEVRHPHWPEAEAIGDFALFGGADAESLAEYLSEVAEDFRATHDTQRDAAAARAIAQYLETEAPTLDQ